ncbi:MAG: hypothetical protein JSR33_04020 [Proteobacteria bacterium]|nr:hypothetical protein [Pseudomonadota bacterium]
MSLFCIIGYDSADSTVKRDQLLEEHLQYLRVLNQKGCLLAAGPLMSTEKSDAIACGSMLVVDFDSQKSLENWFAHEPYNQAGVYKTIQIHPYRNALPFC